MDYVLLVIVLVAFIFLYYTNRVFKARIEGELLLINLFHRVVKIPINEISEMKYLIGTDFLIPFVNYDNGVAVGWNNKIYPVVLGRLASFSEKDIALMKTIIAKNNKILLSKNLSGSVG